MTQLDRDKKTSVRARIFEESTSRGLIRTRTNTNPNGTEANAAGRSGNARALRKQRKCGMIQEGEGHWPNSSKKNCKKRGICGCAQYTTCGV